MPVNISSFSIPDAINQGVSQVNLSYEGKVSLANENNVTIELLVDPNAPIFVHDSNGNLVKSLVYQQAFPLSSGNITKTVTITVTQTPPIPRSCSLRLEARDTKGFKSTKNSHIIIF